MAKHALLTKRSEKIVATLATSGLLATGIAVPLAQVASATTNSQKVGNTCTVTSDGSSQTALRSAIDDALSDIDCQVVEINSSTSGALSLQVERNLELQPSDNTADTRRSLTVKSRTGLIVTPADGYTGRLLRVDNVNESWPANGRLEMEDVKVEGITFSGAESRAISATDYDGGKLTIKNSRFLYNGVLGGVEGGAISSVADLEVQNSVFYGNKGSAIYVDEAGKVEISNSLFVDNTSFSPAYYNYHYSGGAVWANGDIFSVNSTYIDNSTTNLGGMGEWGGALYSNNGNIELALNTFSGNEADEGSSAYSSSGSVIMWGNIFVGPDADEVNSDSSEQDLGYNMADSDGATFDAVTSRQVTPEELQFGTAPTFADVDASTPVTTAPVLPLTSSSVAVKFVTGQFPSEAFSSFFSGKTSKDQLGANRRSGAVDAGAHQFVQRRTSSGAAPVVVQNEPKRITVPGFAPNSTKLTRPMRAEIRKFLRANPDLNNVVCRGFTSAPATVRDRALARNRGKVTCDYIKTLRPEATVTIRSGSHTNKPGKQIRRVSITLR